MVAAGVGGTQLPTGAFDGGRARPRQGQGAHVRRGAPEQRVGQLSLVALVLLLSHYRFPISFFCTRRLTVLEAVNHSDVLMGS